MMYLLDVSFGIFAFMPQGWLFMLFVIILECLVMARVLSGKWSDLRIYVVAALTNIISGIIGILISIELNGGWYLVVWFPWVSRNEVNPHNKGDLKALVIYYALAFVLTLIIETIINVLLLRKRYTLRRILKATVVANILSYVAGTIVLYSYSFH